MDPLNEFPTGAEFNSPVQFTSRVHSSIGWNLFGRILR